MGTQNYMNLEKNVGSTNFITIEPINIKKEFAFEEVTATKVDTSLDNSSKTSEYDYQEATELDCDQFNLITETHPSMESNVKLENDSETSYNNENLVGAFYEINYKTEDGEYNTSEGHSDGGTEYSFVNGESQIVFADGTVLGEDCVLQLVDPSIPESVNGSHTLRCTDGTEIQINIVKKDSIIDTTRDVKSNKAIVPCNSSSIKTYPPSNKNTSINSDPAPTGNTTFTYVTDISDQIKSEANVSFKSIKKSFKSKINGIVCFKCKREFSKPHQLDWHLETFCGTKPFRCYTCNKRFSKDRLNYHVSICRDKAGKIKTVATSSDSD